MQWIIQHDSLKLHSTTWQDIFSAVFILTWMNSFCVLHCMINLIYENMNINQEIISSSYLQAGSNKLWWE